MLWYTCGSQETTCGDWFSPLATWVLWVQHRLPGLVGSTFNTDPSHCFKNSNFKNVFLRWAFHKIESKNSVRLGVHTKQIV